MLLVFPSNYEDDFTRNPWNAFRRFTKYPLPALHPAFLDFRAFRDSLDRERENPFFVVAPENNEGGFATPHLRNWFKVPHKDGNPVPTTLWGHLDLSVNKDACGMAFVSVPTTTVVGTEILPVVRVEVLGCIRAPVGSQIGYNGIRQFVYDLLDRGFFIGLVTCDQFQSVDMIQQLTTRGIPAATMSIDRTTTYPKFVMRPIEGERTQGAMLKALVRESTNGRFDMPMETFFHAIRDGRFSTPIFEEGPDGTTLLEEELFQLESNEQTGKVEKPPSATDDLVQAVAGAVFNAVNNYSMSGCGPSDVDEEQRFTVPGETQPSAELVYERSAGLESDDPKDTEVDFL